MEVRASSPLVGVESLQIHAWLGARCSPLSQSSAVSAPRSSVRALRGAVGSGLSPADRAASGSALDSSRSRCGAVP